jgi:hypothetical protein
MSGGDSRRDFGCGGSAQCEKADEQRKAHAEILAGRRQPRSCFTRRRSTPTGYVVATLTMLAVAVMASLVPAIRASGANPNEVLKGE